MAFFQYGPFFRRFQFFAFGILMGFFRKTVFSVFFDEKYALRACGVFLVFCDFEAENYFFPLFFVALSGGFCKNAFFIFLLKKAFG